MVSEQQRNLSSRFWFIVRSSPPDRYSPLLLSSFIPSSLTCLSASASLLTMDNHNQELQHGVVVARISQSSLAAASASIVPMNSSLDIMNRSAIFPLSNTQQVISLRLSNTNFLYWRLQMKSFLLGQGVYSFVDGTSSCPPSYLISTATSLPSVNPSFLLWKQQDNLIISALLSSLSIEVLHLVVDCKTSQEI